MGLKKWKTVNKFLGDELTLCPAMKSNWKVKKTSGLEREHNKKLSQSLRSQITLSVLVLRTSWKNSLSPV